MRMIGILGGMGPEATASLYMSIINIFQREYGAKYDKDYPPFFIYSLPIPEVVETQEDSDLLIQMLVEGVRRLESSGAEFIAIACNTVQLYLPQMRAAVRVPIISIPEEVACLSAGSTIGILGTRLTVEGRLYDEPLCRKRISLVKPSDTQISQISAVIMNVMSGTTDADDVRCIRGIIEEMRERGAEAIILGCTELPLMITQSDSSLPLLDTTNILARAVVRECREPTRRAGSS